MTARRAEVRVVENLGTRGTTSFTGRPVRRAATAARTVCICKEFFWANPPPAKGELDLNLIGRETKRLGKTMTDGFGILSAFVNGELAGGPFRHRRDQLDRILVLWRAVENGVDLDRGSISGGLIGNAAH